MLRSIFRQMSRARDAFAHTLALSRQAYPLGVLLLAIGAIAQVQAADPPVPSRAVRRELDRAQAQLRDSLSPRDVAAGVAILRQPERVLLRIPARLLFDPESTIPREDAPARGLLLSVRALLRKRSALVARIEVYTDGIGGLDANLRDAQRRADALLAWLAEEGVPARHLQAMGRGARSPLARDDAPEGRIQNRRVELVFEREPAA